MKKLLFIVIFFSLVISMCLEPQTAVSAAQSGLLTWFHQILPALLPFTILSAIFLRSGCMDNPGAHANLYAIIITLSCGFLFGFPIGAKLASDFYEKQLLTRKQALLLCISANNFSIAYVGGFVLPFLFAEQQLEKFTYMMLYLIPLTITLLLFLLPVFRPQKNFHKKTASRFHLDMQIIDAGIISGFEALIKICGYIVLFSLFSQLICQFWQSDSIFRTILLGNLEITNGIQLLQSSNSINQTIKYRLALQFLSFGGVSGFAQTASILKNAGLPVRYYLLGKILLSLCILLFVTCFNIYYR